MKDLRRSCLFPPHGMCLRESFSSATRITHSGHSGPHFRPCALGILSVFLIHAGQSLLPEAPGVLGFTLPRPACSLPRFWGSLPLLLWREYPMGKQTATRCLSNMALIVLSKHKNTYFKFYTIPVVIFQSRFYAHFREQEPEA